MTSETAGTLNAQQSEGARTDPSKVITGICDSVRVCPRLKRKTTWAININLEDMQFMLVCLACIDSEVKILKGQGHVVIKCAAGIGMRVDDGTA